MARGGREADVRFRIRSRAASRRLFVGARRRRGAALTCCDGSEIDVPLDDVVPAFTQGRERLERLVDTHADDGLPVRWAPEDLRACGYCAHCREAIATERDVLLVQGVGFEERAALQRAHIRTIDDLATAEAVAVELPPVAFDRFRRQAALQLQPGELPNVPAFEVTDADLLGRLPKANGGDLFLAFADQGRFDDAEPEPDHLFTAIAVDGASQTYGGDDRQGEALEFVRFLAEVGERRRRFPDMRIYHYSPIDRPHLIDLAARSGAGREQVEALIAEGVLVDLYTIVFDALIIGTLDRSLRQVGRLADPELAHVLAAGGVAADRAEYRRLLTQGDVSGAAALRSRLERENGERCALTKRLRDRLLDLAATLGVELGSVQAPKRIARARSEVSRALEARIGDGARPADELAAAAVDYHALEASVFWRSHVKRLHRHTSQWASRTRGAARIDRLKIEEDWAKGKQGGVTRTLRLRVTASPGTALKVEDQPFLVYDGPSLFDDPRSAPGACTATMSEVLYRGEDELLVRERLPKGATPWRSLPAAVAPARPPRTSAIETALEGWAASLLRGDQEPSAASDLVLRRSPRLTSGGVVRVMSLDGRLDAQASLLQSVEALDGSFIALQGPPGSGKTTVGARVIAHLIERGWRIGVVAQSHAVVEHFLERVVAAGAPADLVAKSVKGDADRAFTVIGKDRVRTFMREHDSGFVVGGTAWTFANLKRVPRGSLDLLVIDEAGQFGLVNAIAVAQAAKNLLLLGDPQQLPQVSQAVHRAAADSSALGWLLGAESVLPERFGFFLDRTWRMHPSLTRAVSDLSYNGALSAHPETRRRALEGAAPGLHIRPVRHVGNTDVSTEEAVEVLRVVREVLGRPWTPGAGSPPRPMTQGDVIVVAPYNAQVECIARVLREAGLPDVEVGTVDRFQGREAAIAIYSATVSSLGLRPQAANFVLGRNRLNVAISRAQWAAYLVHSRKLADFHPRNTAEATALSRFLRLSEFAVNQTERNLALPDQPAA